MNDDCSSCNTTIPENAKFCPSCGKELGTSQGKLSPKYLILVAAVCSAIFLAGWTTQGQLAGSKPTTPFAKFVHEEDDLELARLRDGTKEQPNSIEAWKNYAIGMRDKMLGENANKYKFDYMEALVKTLELAPNDPDALLMFAEFTFTEKVFDKAAEYYQKYLALYPNDLDVRSRYASTSTFLGRYDEAITELNKVLEENPEHFQAKAFLSIAHSQAGSIEKALSIGAEALKIAPSDEAKQRFGAFLDSLREKDKNPVSKITSMLQAHPIVAPKFESAKLVEEKVIEIRLKDFPMKKMPEIAREKFLARLQSSLKKGYTAQLVDTKTNTVMEQVTK